MLGFSSTQTTSAFSGGFRYRPTMSAAWATNSESVLTHQERWRCKLIPSRRSTRQTACTDPPTARAKAGPSQVAWPAGGDASKTVRIRFRKASSYRRRAPGRVAQPLQSLTDKSLPPLDDGVGASVTWAGDLADPPASQAAYNHPCPFHHLFRFRPARGQAL